MADLLVLTRPAKSSQIAQVLAEKREHTGPEKRKKWPQCCRESSWQVRQSRFCQKENEQSHLSRSPDDEGGEIQDE